MYSMKNRELQKNIIRYYLLVDADKNYINLVNQGQDHLKNKTPQLLPYLSLMNQLRNPSIDIGRIDTSWINNPNSPTYLAVEQFLNSNQNMSNIYRRKVFKRNIEHAQSLLDALNVELETGK